MVHKMKIDGVSIKGVIPKVEQSVHYSSKKDMP